MATIAQRHRGFVAGSQVQDGRVLWTVRVKDNTSPHNGKRFTVASVHEGQMLARGLNVDFVVGSVDDLSGHRVPRAVDVRVEAF